MLLRARRVHGFEIDRLQNDRGEAGALSNRRTVIVKAERASVFKKPEEGASLSFEADHNVSLAYVETVPGGWIKVRHSDGQEGFVRAGQVWGF